MKKALVIIVLFLLGCTSEQVIEKQNPDKEIKSENSHSGQNIVSNKTSVNSKRTIQKNDIYDIYRNELEKSLKVGKMEDFEKLRDEILKGESILVGEINLARKEKRMPDVKKKSNDYRKLKKLKEDFGF